MRRRSRLPSAPGFRREALQQPHILKRYTCRFVVPALLLQKRNSAPEPVFHGDGDGKKNAWRRQLPNEFLILVCCNDIPTRLLGYE
jgi:hypothetical protein